MGRVQGLGVFGIPVIDCDPVEPRSKVSLGLPHQIPREGLQVGELLRIVGRYNETEVMAVIGAAPGECPVVGAILFGIEHAAGRVILGDTVAAQVFEVGTERGSLDPVPDHTRLDHRPARPLCPPRCGRKARRPAAAEGAGSRAVAQSPFEATRLLRRGQGLRNGRLDPTGTRPLSRPRPRRMRRSSSRLMVPPTRDVQSCLMLLVYFRNAGCRV